MSSLLPSILLRAALALLPTAALAQETAPVLSFQQNAAGEVIASVSAHVHPCGLTATGSGLTFTIKGTNIEVTQPLLALACVVNPPPYLVYQGTVNLGVLAPGVYTVNWSFPAVSGRYTVTANGFHVGSGMTGNWFNPQQAGQGLALEVLPDASMLAQWFTYAPQNGQAWISAMGPISGNSIALQGYQLAGPGAQFFPNFDPGNLEKEFWGTITLTFTDCNNGSMTWQPVLDGYVAGTMPIQRLTIPAGLSCP
jgi:hypothetical protein